MKKSFETNITFDGQHFWMNDMHPNRSDCSRVNVTMAVKIGMVIASKNTKDIELLTL